MAQQSRLEITLPAVGIDEVARGALGHGVDGEVTAREIVLERHIGGEGRLETTIAGGDLPFEAREGVLLVALGMQEYGEFPPDRPEAAALEFLGCAPHDHPVTFPHRAAEEPVPYGATDEVDFHLLMVTDPQRAARTARLRVEPLRLLALGLLVACLSGCGTTYVLQAARGKWRVMSARQPIDRLVGDERTPATLRERLEAVRAMRAFASAELALPDNASYRSFVQLDRAYVVWNVVATREFSVEPEHWCFPVVGCLAYRGYFSERAARRFAERMAREGRDVFVGGVAAYSTLGHFADPVMSTMLAWGEDELAAMLFHELAH